MTRRFSSPVPLTNGSPTRRSDVESSALLRMWNPSRPSSSRDGHQPNSGGRGALTFNHANRLQGQSPGTLSGQDARNHVGNASQDPYSTSSRGAPVQRGPNPAFATQFRTPTRLQPTLPPRGPRLRSKHHQAAFSPAQPERAATSPAPTTTPNAEDQPAGPEQTPPAEESTESDPLTGDSPDDKKTDEQDPPGENPPVPPDPSKVPKDQSKQLPDPWRALQKAVRELAYSGVDKVDHVRAPLMKCRAGIARTIHIWKELGQESPETQRHHFGSILTCCGKSEDENLRCWHECMETM